MTAIKARTRTPKRRSFDFNCFRAVFYFGAGRSSASTNGFDFACYRAFFNGSGAATPNVRRCKRFRRDGARFGRSVAEKSTFF